MRDENELLAMELVREYTNIPIPKVVHRGSGFNVFERLRGLTVTDKATWNRIAPRQREGLRLQVRNYIQELAKIPHSGAGDVRSLVPSGEIFHDQLPHRGPFESTKDFLHAYANDKISAIDSIAPQSFPVFSHMDWDLSNIIISPNFDAVVGVIDWERACFFPEGGRSIHQMCFQREGWETLFDDLKFPIEASLKAPY